MCIYVNIFQCPTPTYKTLVTFMYTSFYVQLDAKTMQVF